MAARQPTQLVLREPPPPIQKPDTATIQHANTTAKPELKILTTMEPEDHQLLWCTHVTVLSRRRLLASPRSFSVFFFAIYLPLASPSSQLSQLGTSNYTLDYFLGAGNNEIRRVLRNTETLLFLRAFANGDFFTQEVVHQHA